MSEDPATVEWWVSDAGNRVFVDRGLLGDLRVMMDFGETLDRRGQPVRCFLRVGPSLFFRRERMRAWLERNGFEREAEAT